MTRKDRPRSSRPTHLWVVGILSLLWNGFGAFDYLATQLRLDFYLSQFTPEQLAYFTSFPSWAVSAWAFGVWGAFAGSIALLLARAWAVHAFSISIAGLAVSSVYNLVLSDGVAIVGPAAIIMTALISAVAVALLWYAVRQRSKGVLRGGGSGTREPGLSVT
jgi:hypothetical protein